MRRMLLPAGCAQSHARTSGTVGRVRAIMRKTRVNPQRGRVKRRPRGPERTVLSEHALRSLTLLPSADFSLDGERLVPHGFEVTVGRPDSAHYQSFSASNKSALTRPGSSCATQCVACGRKVSAALAHNALLASASAGRA